MAVDEMGQAETFRGYAPDLGYEFLRKQSLRMIIKQEDVKWKSMRYSSVTVRRVIQEYSGISVQTTVSQSVIRYTLYM